MVNVVVVVVVVVVILLLFLTCGSGSGSFLLFERESFFRLGTRTKKLHSIM